MDGVGVGSSLFLSGICALYWFCLRRPAEEEPTEAPERRRVTVRYGEPILTRAVAEKMKSKAFKERLEKEPSRRARMAKRKGQRPDNESVSEVEELFNDEELAHDVP